MDNTYIDINKLQRIEACDKHMEEKIEEYKKRMSTSEMLDIDEIGMLVKDICNWYTDSNAITKCIIDAYKNGIETIARKHAEDIEEYNNKCGKFSNLRESYITAVQHMRDDYHKEYGQYLQYEEHITIADYQPKRMHINVNEIGGVRVE